MKKWLCAALVLCLLLPARAAGPAAPGVAREPTLVLCRAAAFGRFPAQPIRMVVTLWRGETAVASWTARGRGEVRLVRTYAATDGQAYRLTARAAAEAAPVALTTAACAALPAGPDPRAAGPRPTPAAYQVKGSSAAPFVYITQKQGAAPAPLIGNNQRGCSFS